MADSTGFYNRIYPMLTDMVNEFMRNVSEALVNGLQPVLLSALTIYFMCKAWSIMYGRGDQQGTTMKDLTMQVIKMAFVVTFFCNAPHFYEYCIKGMWGMDEWFSKIINAAIPGCTTTNSLDALDQVYSSILTKAQTQESIMMEAVFNNISIKKVVLGLCTAGALATGFTLLELAVIISTFIGFLILVTNTLGLAFILAFGPLFGSMALFPQTKELFTGWIKTSLNFILTKVFITGGCFMMIALADNLYKTVVHKTLALMLIENKESALATAVDVVTGQFSNSLDIVARMVFMAIVFLTFGLFFSKCPSMATSLVGGMQMGGGKTAEGLNDKVTSGVQAAGKAAVAGPAGAAAGAVQTGLRNGAATALKGGHMRTYRMLKSLAAFGSRAPKPSKPSKPSKS